MPDRIRTIHTSVTIAGQEIPVLEWKCNLSNQGSMATAEAKTALSLLEASGVNVISASQSASGASFSISAGYNGNMVPIFSGILDECEFDPLEDTFELKGRDQAAALNDGKQTVAGLNYRNQTIGQIVQQIVSLMGLQGNITDPGIMAGPLMNGENSFNPHPQTYWSMLQKLAEDVGYECYMTTDGTLYFGPEQSQGSITLDVAPSADSGAQNPVKTIKFKYNPRNNSNITVKVVSQNTQSTQATTGTATAKPQTVSGSGKTSDSFSGGNSKVSYPSGGAKASSKTLKSTYYLRDSGTDAGLASKRAQAKADDLAKRQVIASCTVEGLPSLKVHSHVTFVKHNVSLLGMEGVDFNVAEASHSFDMTSGLMTEFRALALVN